MQGNYGSGARLVQPYLVTNLWHSFSHTSRVMLNQDPVSTPNESTSLEVGLGISTTLNQRVGLYALASHTNDLDSGHQQDYAGSLGLRLNW
ncbi:autotransporter outer membrane beta-barrel domain-containing protein [Budvicia diplopodorum]|uniref:autotransporter outer membrane beta-barrel domain-containing protein n=1 Tax=Budvicia diplopodorum TaxID=1119056 RepID=UPI00248413FF|nr:autotransporter outer membrane beta-barrel domain-containing protein [Budvicia diplopodorum]